jgi:Outer membrane lipoprotein carrier protein LolA
MLISRRALLAGAASLGVSARALAEDAPLDLQLGKRVKPPKDRPTDAPKLSDAEIIAKANDFLNTTRFMSADFVQIGPDGRRSEGLLVLLRPGRMLFRYKPPQKMEIVADGRSLEVRDQKLATQDLYLIGQTPLKFLLSDHIDLANDTKVKPRWTAARRRSRSRIRRRSAASPILRWSSTPTRSSSTSGR